MSTENERIKEIRKALNLTLDDFGKRLGVTNVAISNIEHGNRKVTSQMKKAICYAFGVNEAWLESGQGNMFISDDIKQITAFEDYLKSLGFTVKQDVTKWHYEDPDDPDPSERIQIVDDVEYTLSRNGQKAVFTAEEYNQLQTSANDVIEGQFYKKIHNQN